MNWLKTLMWRMRRKKRLTAVEWAAAMQLFEQLLKARLSMASADNAVLMRKFILEADVLPGSFMRNHVLDNLNIALTNHPSLKQLVDGVMAAFVAGMGDDEKAWEQLCYNLAHAFEVNGPRPEMCVATLDDVLLSPEGVMADVADIYSVPQADDDRIIPARDVMHELLINNRQMVFLAIVSMLHGSINTNQ